MKLADTNQTAGQMIIETMEGRFACEACAAATPTPLEYLLFSWDQFVNELEFE